MCLLPQEATIFIDAGIPNIRGTLAGDDVEYAGSFISGAFQHFYNEPYGPLDSGRGGVTTFDASRCSLVYGRSDTVQPSAMTVNYFIRAR